MNRNSSITLPAVSSFMKSIFNIVGGKYLFLVYFFTFYICKVFAVMLRICVLKTIKFWSNEHGILQKFCIMMLHEHALQLVLMTGTWRAICRHNHVFISLCQYNEHTWHQHLVMALHLLPYFPRKISEEGRHATYDLYTTIENCVLIGYVWFDLLVINSM